MGQKPFLQFFTLHRKQLVRLFPSKIGFDEWVQFCNTILREVPYFAEIFGIEAS